MQLHGKNQCHRDGDDTELQFYSCVRGYIVYQDGWLPVRDEVVAS